MNIEDQIKQKLRMRGFGDSVLLNNRGLINATIDDTILTVFKANIQGEPKEASTCRTFMAEGSTTSATKCFFCGKEKFEH